MPWGEVYPALESKAIDGHETPVDTMYAAKMYEVQKYLSLTRHAYTALPVVMNKKRFDCWAGRAYWGLHHRWPTCSGKAALGGPNPTCSSS